MALLTTTVRGLLSLLMLQVAACWVLDPAYGDGVFQFTYEIGHGSRPDLLNISQYKIDHNRPPPYAKNETRLPAALTHKKCFHGSDHDLDRGDLDLAKRGLMNWCERYTPFPSSIVISVVNNATVYAAFSYTDRGVTYIASDPICSARGIDRAWASMDKKCGSNKWASAHVWFLEREYGRARRGTRIWS
ncbi:uncharacterized protein MAM_05136 [Metarhizium album ARSEF 1941]|uniref:Uncharacterized protein n=1 Tax=Metarhizium album (strain ARSEF 1941) TaxID=1081103 RepID=A0A0B2WU83_METAS|nr:uncharacterized protein MAM_05136 [Metarhizium album ARSEF 1941]KHN97027.1 hypothetical protein MAM_05136 [Metarhizium album ARSEF 1941]